MCICSVREQRLKLAMLYNILQFDERTTKKQEQKKKEDDANAKKM